MTGLDTPRVVGVRPIATPLPITFLGLMIATTVLATYELGYVPKADLREVGWVIVAVPVPMQLLAAAWGFISRSAAAATGSSILAAAWLAVGFVSITGAPHGPGPNTALGMMMFANGAAMLVPTLAELRTGALLPAALMTATAVRFLLTAVAGVVHTTGWSHVSGWAGIVLAALALYAALALELEGTNQQPLLPVFRVAAARRAMTAPLEQQLEGVDREPGVRRTI